MWVHLNGSGEITVPELNDLAGYFGSVWGDHFGPLCHELVTIESCKVVLYGSGDDVIEGASAVDVVGSDSGDALTAQVAVCVSWQIAPHYRGGHPRSYIPPPSGSQLSSNTSWDGGFLTSATSAAISFHNNMETPGSLPDSITSIEHGIYSFVRDGEWRTPPVFYRIAGATVDSRVDTQRRRLGSDRS